MRRTLPLSVVVFATLAARLPAEDWPGFRGPTGQGHSAEKDVPLEWDAKTNVAWKAELPGEGWSSPVVSGDRVFVTATTDDGTSCRVIAVDRTTGRILWNVEVFRQSVTRKERKNSFATPTPAVDGERVYAVFSSGGVAALTLDGKPAWVNRDITHYSRHGLGASPRLYRDLLVMPYDPSHEPPDEQTGWKKPWEKARVVAFDTATGKVRWEGKRGLSRIAHTTPIVVREGDKDRLISTAGDVIQAFDPADGKRLWSAYSQGEGVTPSPVFGDGLVFACSGFEKPTIRAVKLGGDGDVTNTHIAWEQTRGVPTQPSPVYANGHLFTVTDQGIAHCLSAKTGEVVWQQRIGAAFSASPVVAAGRVYFLAEDGEATVIEAKPEFKVLARNKLGERCQASLAISQGQIFIRTERHLYCIGKPSGAGPVFPDRAWEKRALVVSWNDGRINGATDENEALKLLTAAVID